MGTMSRPLKVNYLARTIAKFHNRGEASIGKVKTMLNFIKGETDITHLRSLN